MNGKTISRALIPATFLTFVAVAAALSQEAVPAPPDAPAPVLREAAFRYDGQLTWDGAPFTGPVNLEFRLFDDLVEGALVGAPQLIDALHLIDGHVSLDLDFQVMLEAGRPYWLEVMVNGTALLPRQKVVLSVDEQRAILVGTLLGHDESAAVEAADDPKRRDLGGAANIGRAGASSQRPGTGRPDVAPPPGTHAPPAGPDGGGGAGGGGVAGGVGWQISGANVYLLGGNVGIGTATPAHRLDVFATSPANQTRAVQGRVSAGTGITIGVSGQSDSVQGRGVLGVATAPVGPTIGLFGLTNSRDGTGLFGLANHPTGVTTGLVGQSTSPNGFALRALGAKSYFDGNVGIGTSAPDSPLHVEGPTHGGAFRMRDLAASGGLQLVGEWEGNAAGPQVRFSGAGVGWVDIGQNGTGDFVIEESDTKHFVIKTDGDIGIGNEFPESRLVVERPVSDFFRLVDFTITTAPAADSDLLQLMTGGASSDDMQFIECERGNDIKFRVWGNGDVTADGTITGGGADYAEMIKVSTGAASVEAGDVLVIDPDNPTSFVRSFEARSTLVAGIYSTKPGVLGSEHDWDRLARDLYPGPADSSLERPAIRPLVLGRAIDEVPLAMVGIVPCKVTDENGPIRPGDLLVTSSIPGHAMRDENPRAGTIVGKALDEHRSGTGLIKVLVTLQ